MSIEEENLEESQNDLKWISLKEESFTQKLKSKGIFGILVPIGCVATVGILAGGVLNMMDQNSSRQQLFMRYRVLAQGITLGVCLIGIYRTPK